MIYDKKLQDLPGKLLRENYVSFKTKPTSRVIKRLKIVNILQVNLLRALKTLTVDLT